ncbi:uncharacterized protein A4U43_C04F3350 [Asparagus officinalis]|uniref:Uncharacterized protein n=1 Tax=Asparagus officinalis TaxID=4686 RepID=A0A5P1F0M2_ASPOF|nr:uncharacterized protein LOC109836516 [Asparagus officinalis]ONK70967.1 uncharacterized protein A4U43_C04F3350 [Asparagus officinalis]
MLITILFCLFASLLLGASLAMMVCGSVTFVIGFILMHWVLGVMMVFYFLGILRNIMRFWMTLSCSIQKEISGRWCKCYNKLCSSRANHDQFDETFFRPNEYHKWGYLQFILKYGACNSMKSTDKKGKNGNDDLHQKHQWFDC